MAVVILLLVIAVVVVSRDPDLYGFSGLWAWALALGAATLQFGTLWQ